LRGALPALGRHLQLRQFVGRVRGVDVDLGRRLAMAAGAGRERQREGQRESEGPPRHGAQYRQAWLNGPARPELRRGPQKALDSRIV
jgi:hypothetical protein